MRVKFGSGGAGGSITPQTELRDERTGSGYDVGVTVAGTSAAGGACPPASQASVRVVLACRIVRDRCSAFSSYVRARVIIATLNLRWIGGRHGTTGGRISPSLFGRQGQSRETVAASLLRHCRACAEPDTLLAFAELFVRRARSESTVRKRSRTAASGCRPATWFQPRSRQHRIGAISAAGAGGPAT